jgi:hypothetical protein
VLRASGFALALIAVTGGIGIAARRKARDGSAELSPGRLPGDDRNGRPHS